MQISKYKAIELLRSTKGKIFSCEFIKKDGTLRRMVARLGVAKNLKGGRNGASSKNSLITVYDMAKQAYRMVNLETLKTVKVNGVTYKVV